MTYYATSMAQKILLIYNPNSGKHKFKAYQHRIEELLKKEELVIYATKAPHDATHKVASEGQNYDIIISCGGDGTYHEVLNGLMQIEKELRPKLLILPLGTVNDMAGILKYPRKVQKIIGLIDKGTVKRVNVCKVNDKYVSYVLATGSLSSISYETASEIKAKIGRTAYILQAIKILKNIKSDSIRITSEDENGLQSDTQSYLLLLFLMYRRFGGVDLTWIIRRKNYLDNNFIMLRGFNGHKRFFLIHILLFMLSFGHYSYFQKIDTFKKASITAVDGEKKNWNIDGECGLIDEHIELELLHREVEVYVGEKALKLFRY